MEYLHNDYEILFLIKEGDQEALNLMFQKYSNFIAKKIHKYNLQDQYEDMYQEGLMMLYQSIQMFDPSFNKTFTRYFELVLENKYKSFIMKKSRRYQIFNEHQHYIYETFSTKLHNEAYYQMLQKEIAKILTKREFLVYTLRELKNYSVQYIKDNYNIEEKVIYNSLHRAKAKIKDHFNC